MKSGNYTAHSEPLLIPQESFLWSVPALGLIDWLGRVGKYLWLYYISCLQGVIHISTSIWCWRLPQLWMIDLHELTNSSVVISQITKIFRHHNKVSTGSQRIGVTFWLHFNTILCRINAPCMLTDTLVYSGGPGKYSRGFSAIFALSWPIFAYAASTFWIVLNVFWINDP